MDYQYLASTLDKRLVKGKLSAHSEEEATRMLEYGGYRVVNLKLVTPFLIMERLLGPVRVKSKEIIMLSRQLALLLESGVDVATSLELIQDQITNRGLKTIIGKVNSDVRGGASLSQSLSKHPKIFSQIYHRTIAVGEEGGNLEVVLRRMADYMEKAEVTKKKVVGALRYPIIVFVVAIIVVGILVTYVMPTFRTLYASIGAKLPAITTMLLDGTDWLMHYGLYLLVVIGAAVGSGFAYIRTPPGRSRWDRLVLRFPIVGRIFLLNELSRCCRSISFLLNVGLPVLETIALAIEGSSNMAVRQALTGVQQELLGGESISSSMARRPLFMLFMVAMTAVGEKTGRLANTLATVAESFETEADDKTTAFVALLQPALTILISAVVGFIALAMVSAMYGIYGQLGQ